MKKFPEVVLAQVGMSQYWLRLGVIPTLFVHGPNGGRLLVLLSAFMESKVVARDLGFVDFNLPLIDDSFNYSGSNTQNEKDKDSELSVKVHDSYDDTNDGHTPPVSTDLVTIFDDDGDDRSDEQPLVHWKRGRDSISLAALAAVLAGRECSSGRVLKRSRSLHSGAFHSFANSLYVGRPSVYITQLNVNSPARDANAPHPSGPIYVSSWEYRRE
ncbi:unnamed protein product [Lactuca saligna]|uniref:Uncharacterized protein n=1 Tax=Lactuca saligna TaxID=75948 RepID=A0AA36DUK2_LACSI|nr:unnamed protein product [Lactuca saligna]